MKSWVYIFASFIALIGVGCKNDKPIHIPEGTLVVEHDYSVVRLNNTKDTFLLTFTTSSDWRISTTSKNFTVEPMKGSGSSEPQTITITAMSENVSSAAVERGSFNICIDQYSLKHNIKVVQCAASERNLLAWLMGTSLSYHFDNNIECMKQALAQDILGNDRFLLLEQLSKTEGIIKELYYDEKEKTSAELILGKIEIPAKLTSEGVAEFVSKMMHIAPAESYAMIIGGHSTAWLPATPPSGGIELSVGEKYIPNWLPAGGAEMTRTIGENNGKITVEELSDGLSAVGEKFEWILFDVCFMSSLEACYALRNNADYLIGSPCEIMGYGAPYDVMLPDLLDDDFDGACQAYQNFYTTKYYGSKSGCIATVVTKELDALAATVKSLNEKTLLQSFDIMRVQPYEGRDSHIFFDAEHYVLNAYDDDACVTAFCEQLDKSVVNRYHTSQFYSMYNDDMNDIVHYSGVSITPDDGCISVLESQVVSMRLEVEKSKSELDDLRDKLYDEGIEPEER